MSLLYAVQTRHRSQPVIVAVIDEEVDITHEDLRGIPERHVLGHFKHIEEVNTNFCFVFNILNLFYISIAILKLLL